MMKTLGDLLRVVPVLPVLIAAGGCVGATYIQTGAVYPARSRDCAIEVFSTGLPDRDYEEIGILEGEGSLWKADMEDVLPKLMEEACLAGGHAIVLQSVQKYARGEDGDDAFYASATVIRWERE